MGASGAAVIAVALSGAEALGGDLVPGDRVDVYSTVGDGADATTTLFAPGLRVVQVGDASGAIGSNGDLTVHLAVEAELERLQLVHAAHAGTITLVRTTSATVGTVASTADEQERAG